MASGPSQPTPPPADGTPPPADGLPRVLVVGKRAPDYFADNVLTCLEDFGYETRSVEPFQGTLSKSGRMTARVRAEVEVSPRLARRLQQHVLEAADEFRPELTLVLDARVAYPIVSALKQASHAPVVFWFPDHSGNLGREMHLLAGYDAVFLKDSVIARRYRDSLGINAFYLPEGCNPRWHRPAGELAPSTENPSVSVVGNMYVTRFLLVRKLMRCGIDVRIHGSPWARWLPSDATMAAGYRGRPVFREEKARAFRSASVVLNNVGVHEADGLNARLFEATACGGIVLTEWRDRLPELFDVPGEVDSYRSFDELVDRIRALAALPDDHRNAIAEAGSARAHRDHTLRHRVETIAAALGRG